MEPLKPRDKVTQHMTRDGLTLDNQTTGESVNVSSREAEQEYTAQPEGAAEKILERADKLEAAKEALPKKRVVTKETVYDEAKGKAKSRLYFDKVEKAPPQLKPNPASRPIHAYFALFYAA